MKPLIFLLTMFLFAVGMANIGWIDDSDGYLRLKYALGVGR